MLVRPAHGRVAFLLGVAAGLWGSLVAWHYHRLGLTLSHYDARGHLVVARRIVDSITPGWQQIGAVWLPLPHLLNAIPVQINALYRTGASAVVISIASFAVASAAISWLVALLTGSVAAGAVSAVVFAANPNVLYLQATPMTEPLLCGLLAAAVALLVAWIQREATPRAIPPGFVGLALALACLTRYEAWPVTAGAVLCAPWARWRAGDGLSATLRRTGAIALYPAVAIGAFLVFSRIVVGHWFVSDGFFVPENTALGRPVLAVDEIVWGVRALSGYVLVGIGVVGLAALVALGLLDRRRGEALVAATLVATAAVPWLAFMKGHPYRIRYMVPLILAEAVAAGAAAGYSKRARPVVIAVLALAAIVDLRPLDLQAPMVVEAQWDQPNIAGRRPVGDYLRAHYDGTTIMASMGSLGHYMQELSRDGFDLRDFLHEGNGDIWLAAVVSPRPFAGWLLIEEKAEGGDELAAAARERPAFLEGFSRVAEGAGLALYRRVASSEVTPQNFTAIVAR